MREGALPFGISVNERVVGKMGLVVNILQDGNVVNM